MAEAEVNIVKGKVDELVRPLLFPQSNFGVVVGVVCSDSNSVFSYGRTSATTPQPPSGETLFEIGSITKVFTSALLSSMVANGLVRLDEPVRDLLPELSNLPPQITLVRLATHTSGLPRLPSNFMRKALHNPANPYAAYTANDLCEYLSQYKPKQKPESVKQINYSNLGAGLLGYTLARKLGTSYEEAVVNWICDKLDLPDTRVTLSPEQEARLATPHAGNGKPTQNWDLPALAGAGALRSTVNDLFKFVRANLNRPPSMLADVLQACHEQRAGSFARLEGIAGTIFRLFQRFRKKQNTKPYTEGIGLGWIVGHLGSSGKQVHWHNGGTGGYRAFVGFVKDTDTGVVVLNNRGDRESDALFSKPSIDDVGFGVLEEIS